MRPAKPHWKFIVDFRILSIILILSMIPLLLVTWWLVNSYRESYLETQGISLAEDAEEIYNYLNNYLGNQVIAVAGLTEIPTLRAAISQSNLELRTNPDEAQRRTAEIEAGWQTADYRSPALRAILGNPASAFLQRYTSLHSSFREIIVTDSLGRTVAATGKTSEFRHVNDDWWKEAYYDGLKGAVYIGDVHYHESAKDYCFDMAQPFVDPKEGVIGVIMVGIGARGIHALIGSTRTGFGGTPALIRTDGSIVSSPDYGPWSQQRYPAVQEVLSAQKKGKRHFITQSAPRAITGLNTQSFVATYPHLNWVIAVSTPEAAVAGPLTQLLHNIVLLVLSVILVDLLVVLWLSREESRPIPEQDPHLERI